MRNISHDSRTTGHPAALGLGRIGQQILNLLENVGARAAERRDSLHLDRRLLDDCGLTPADLQLGLRDLNDNDFRVAPFAERRAA